ncbi:hypothetical protein ADJ77_09875 [Prevotella fusca JCM 17724]|uniref:Uncharacterized protein n=1 Tax=Prevotella fusca JCM 17724 TaxID=1236517 RepID=A0A0K1NN55_9BACT|nr:hypothetical protein ADJ77_09875 [Prevotella fusca JCM 17724]
MFLPFFFHQPRQPGVRHCPRNGDALDSVSIPVSGDSGFKNRLVLPHVQVPPTPFVTEVKYREFLPINMDGVMAIFEMRRLETEPKAYTPVWYDYPKSDGLTKKDKVQDKNAEKANTYYALPSSTNNLFPY